MTHTSTEQPEALMRLADNYAEACFDQGLNQRTIDDKPETEREKLEKAIRRMHTRISELEAQLSAIDAGGVEPLRKPVEDGWLQDGPLLYRLTDERRPRNRDEIIVTMANSSRTEEARTRRAGELLDAIRAAAEIGKVQP